MSSNQEASKTAAKGGSEQPPVVNDKRRFTPDGEPLDTGGSATGSGAEDTGSSNNPSAEIEALQAKFREADEKRNEAERKVAEMADRYRRAQEQLKQETEEQRARLQRTFDQRLEVARGDIIGSLLDSLDNLKRALTVAEKAGNRDADFIALLEGVRATATMFEARMQAYGLTAVPSVGQEFNPEIHEAVEMVETTSENDHKVVGEFQTGYKFGDRLLRPARVRVGRAN
jgi:molecular chaperone GrpE